MCNNEYLYRCARSVRGARSARRAPKAYIASIMHLSCIYHVSIMHLSCIYHAYIIYLSIRNHRFLNFSRIPGEEFPENGKIKNWVLVLFASFKIFFWLVFFDISFFSRLGFFFSFLENLEELSFYRPPNFDHAKYYWWMNVFNGEML